MRLYCMPSFDDELKSHPSGQSEAIGVEPAPITDVERMGRRHGRRRRALGVVGAMALVVGAAVGARPLFRDDGTVLDVAADVAAASGSITTTTTTAATAPADSGVLVERTDVESSSDQVRSDSTFGYGYGGGEWIVPWGDGFLMLGTVWEPAPLPGPGSPYAESFPPEIIDAVRAAGATTLDEAMAALADAGLLEQATDLVISDPALADLYASLQSGGTSSFVAQTSPDGLHWSDIPGFALPMAGAQIDRVVSDGTHLVIAQRADSLGITSGLEPVIGFAAGRDSGQVSLTISVTQNLTDWQTFEISEPTAEVPAYVSTNQWLSALAYNADGWLATVQSSWNLDLWSLVPSDIRDGQGVLDFRATTDGLEITFYDPGDDFGFGPVPLLEGSGAVSTSTLPASTDAVSASAHPVVGPAAEDPAFIDMPITDTTFHTWEELGIDPVEIQQYLDESGGYGRLDTTITIGSWDSQPVTASLTGTSGDGIEEIVGTDAGFIGQKFGRLLGEPQLLFSPDGVVWDAVEAPTTQWFGGLAVIDGGVLLSAGGESGTEQWIGAPDGSTWTRVETLDIGSGTRQAVYFEGGNRGVITVVDVHQYQDRDYSRPPVEFDVESSYDGKLFHLFGHADGTADLTITDAETGDIVAEVSGNFDGASADFAVIDGDMVTIVDPDGNTITELPVSLVMDTVLPAREAAIDASGWTQPPLVPEMPEFVLIATADGVNWLTAPLDGSEYPSTMAINGNLVAIRTSAGWQTFTIG